MNLQTTTPFLWQGSYSKHQITGLITGIGTVNTALHLAPLLANNSYQVAIQVGIAGSYLKEHTLGTVVEVIQETYADLGAENNDGSFLSLKELGFSNFVDKKQSTYYNTLHNPQPSFLNLVKVKSNTVHLCSGTWETIRKRLSACSADIENMEGAAFFQACILYEQPFYAFRAISNYVAPRNFTQWNIPLAVKNLSEQVLNFLKNL